MMKVIKSILKVFAWIISTLIEIPAIIFIVLGIILWGIGALIYNPDSFLEILKTLKNFKFPTKI